MQGLCLEYEILTYFSAPDLDFHEYMVNKNRFGNNSKFKM